MASTSTAMQDKSEEQRQVPITLRTSQATLSIPSIPYLVPTTWRRTQLSTLVNRLLQQDPAGEASNTAAKSIPFDFIIDGELLRTSIDQYLASKGLTEESTIEIEYIRSTLPPTYTAAFEHDDWVSGVDASRDGYFLTSSYDGTVRLFGTSTLDSAIQTLKVGATASLTDVCWIPNSKRAASTSMDGRLRIVNVPTTKEAISSDTQATCSVLSSSTVQTTSVPMPLSSVRADASGSRLITAGWDGCVAIWSAEEGKEEQREVERTKKRRKAVNGSAAAEDAVDSTTFLTPLSHLWHSPPANVIDKTPSTNSRVSAALWGDDKEAAFSAGWNGSVRQWDVTTGAGTSTKTADKVILCMDKMQASNGILVTGHMDRSAAMWDMRSSMTNISLSLAGAHAGPICAIRRHSTSAHLFVTGSHDGQVKLWDNRSNAVALFSLVRPSKSKVLTLDWDSSGQTVVAGGEDCKLTVHRGEGIGRENVPSSLS